MVRVQNAARPLFAHAKWIKPENLHLTLKFLGAIPPEKLPDISLAARQCAGRGQAFALSLGPILALPNVRHARVLSLGCSSPEPLLGLHAALDHIYMPLGFEAETRAFRPHITLARFAKPTAIELPAADSLFWENDTWPVTQLALVQSRPGTGGSLYTPVDVWPLGA